MTITNTSTKIKICGLTSVEDASYLNQYGANFAGVVMFFPKSKRNMQPKQVPAILEALNSDIKKVAVVVKPSIDEVKIIESLGFDYIQIHGELSEELLAVINIPVLKAFNVNDMGNYEAYHSNPKIVGYVFDAIEPGSGKTFDWKLVDNIPRDEKLLILAGGLNASNVAAAISMLHPDGVDVSSGVEYTDRQGKNPELIKAFTEAVHNIS